MNVGLSTEDIVHQKVVAVMDSASLFFDRQAQHPPWNPWRQLVYDPQTFVVRHAEEQERGEDEGDAGKIQGSAEG